MTCSMVQYSAVQSEQCNAVQYGAVWFYTMQCNAVQCVVTVHLVAIPGRSAVVRGLLYCMYRYAILHRAMPCCAMLHMP